MTARRIRKLVKARAGIALDISLGGAPGENSVSFKDLGHDPRRLPWPLPNRCVHTAVATHVLEYVAPEDFFAWFDELHRTMRPGGILHASGPYGGDESVGWLSDPQHRVRIVETTFAWLDPRAPLYALQETERGRKPPKPWTVIAFWRVPGTLGTVSWNATLVAGVPQEKKK